MKKIKKVLLPVSMITLLGLFSLSFHTFWKSQYSYDDFEKPGYCNQCHDLFHQQWDQSMMSDAYNHEWDEIEYFELAVAHTENDPDVPAEVHEGCNGCHTPMAFLAGDMPLLIPGPIRVPMNR